MFKRIVFLCSLALLALLPAQAQDVELAETFTAADGSFSFQHPADWFTTTEESGVVLLTNEEALLDVQATLTADSMAFIFISPAVLTAAEISGESPTEVLEAYLQRLEVPDAEISEVSLDERVAQRVSFAANTFTVFALELSDGSIGIIGIETGSPLIDEAEALALAIVATFDIPRLVVPANLGSAPCTIRTDQERFAAVRVGPGINRTSIAYLPADKDFEVLGKAEAQDGSLWWKVDKEEAAPGKSANETWVEQEQVTASGNCELVVDADAPPLIPITAPQPTSAPGSSPANAPAAPVTGGSGRGIFIALPDWQNQLPADMRAASQAASRLTVYVEQQLVTVQSETYVKNTGETTTVYRNRVDFVVRVVLTSSGQEVARQTFSGSEPPPFPQTLSISGTLNGNPPTFDVVLPWLRGLLG